MLNLGLTNAERLAFEKLLVSPHHLEIHVQVMDLNHNYLGNLSSYVMDGQVDLSATDDITRTLNMSLWDPFKTLNVVSNAPDDGALFMDRMVKVIYAIAPPDRSVWYSCPIFTGPITKLDRSQKFLNVEAAGKEHLSIVSVWTPHTYKKGLKRTNVIKDLLRDRGETKFMIRDSKKVLAKNLGIGYTSVPWNVAKSVANSMDQMLFYDARGFATMRRRSARSVFTFTEKHFVTLPQIGYDITSVINSVIVIGGKPKGSKKKIQYKVTADRKHPLSPWSLGRNGKPRFLTELIEDDSIDSLAEAKQVGKSRLYAGLSETIEVSFDSLVIPHLEVNDMIRVQHEGVSVMARYRTASIPFGTSAVGTVGYLKKVTPKKRKIRRNRK